MSRNSICGPSMGHNDHRRQKHMFPGLYCDPARNLAAMIHSGLLNRLVYVHELSNRVGQLESGADPEEIVKALIQGIAELEEFLSANPTYVDVAGRLYATLYGRFPTSEEIDVWVGELESGAIAIPERVDLMAGSEAFSNRLKSYMEIAGTNKLKRAASTRVSAVSITKM